MFRVTGAEAKGRTLMELWDVYDRSGRKTGAVKEKESEYLRENTISHGSLGIQRPPEILIQQRSWSRPIYQVCGA